MASSEEIQHGASQVQVPIELVNNVRQLLSDYGITNELVDGEEWSDQFIAKNIVDVVADFNYSPPPIDATLNVLGLYNDAAQDLRPWVEEATTGRILRFGSIRLMRNALPYTAGSISYDPNSIWQYYQQLGERLWAEWQQKRDAKKQALNLDLAWGAAHTDLLTRSIYDEGNVITVVGGSI